MANNHANTLLSRGRPLAIVLMLSMALLLIGVLGWQSWKLQQSHMETADSVLREYAILAADEFGRRAIATLGYSGYYTLITRMASLESASEMRATADTDPVLTDASKLAATYFVIQADSVEFDGEPLSGRVEDLLELLLAENRAADEPYQSRRTADGAEQVIIAWRESRDDHFELVGFVVSNNGISHHLSMALDRGPLLPPSLAGGAVNNDMLFVRVIDPAGQVIFEENPAYDSHLTVSRTQGKEYQGILEGFQFEVSLDPYSADTLVIGGLPRSRLPLLLFAMLLVVVLMITAIWLFRREQAVMKLRSDFVAQVSHELRTPLTQIRMFAETLLLKRTRNEGEKQRSLEIINRESQRLSHLVNNILQFSSGSVSQKIDRTGQFLAPIVVEVCDIVRATDDSVNIAVETDDQAYAEVDADAVRQIILNLLDNAIKYGPKAQEISVKLSRDEHWVRLTIEDQGPGIPRSEHRRVFSPFYRLRREDNTAISGTGIGLSVVRDLVTAMNGRCHVENGTTGARVCIEFKSTTGNE